ncbi:hypothetical protein GCM10010260_54030 [Streptomyces filipinensis]|uniref:Uncharacterized protein n=1 Tax=Streptomyces filipinensis TaxID=66887 RepID=A0A918IFM1_9ACTN|nr:hypothetical protein GCM10010260_54030 [Streptomyces filipinensis]
MTSGRSDCSAAALPGPADVIPPTATLTCLAHAIDLEVPTIRTNSRMRLALSTFVGSGGHNVAWGLTSP